MRRLLPTLLLAACASPARVKCSQRTYDFSTATLQPPGSAIDLEALVEEYPALKGRVISAPDVEPQETSSDEPVTLVRDGTVIEQVPVQDWMFLFDVLAGAYDPAGDSSTIRVLRRRGHIVFVDGWEFVANGDAGQNIELRPGDLVLMSSRWSGIGDWDLVLGYIDGSVDTSAFSY